MLFDDGVVFTCTLSNIAPNGRKPVMQLKKVGKYWFSERTIGFNRQYLAMGLNEQIDMLIRIPHSRDTRIGMYALLGNGDQFRIDNVQHVIDPDNFLRYTDLTLSRLEDYYDVFRDETCED